MGKTNKLAAFIVKTGYEDIPDEAINTAKRCILDCIGVTLAGCTHPIAKIMESYLKEAGGRPSSTVIGLGIKTSPGNAALTNGTLGHVLDYDDFILPGLAHVTVPVLPAVLALGESTDATGKNMLLAYILGNEIFCKLGAAVSPSHWYKGFHATGTVGTYGAVAAASKLLKLDEEHTINAFGIASSLASGLKQNIGTMTKPLHAGHAAEGGIRAALLAERGFTGAMDAFEGQMGFAKVMADSQDYSVFDKFANPWDIVHTPPFIKPHPSCSGTHAAMNAMLSLIKEYNIKPNEVEHVNAGMPSGVLEELIYAEPKSVFQARFSMQFCLAILLLERKAGLAQFTDAKVRDLKTVDLMKQISLSVDPELAKSVPLECLEKTATVMVRMKNGRECKRTADIRHLTWDEIKSKYEECASLVLPENKLKRSIDIISGLEKLKNLNSLIEAITSNRGATYFLGAGQQE